MGYAVVVTALGCVAVVSAQTDSWTRIAFCDTPSRHRGTDFDLQTVAQMAQSATRVRICTTGSTVDCITSRPNTFPITNLRAGRWLMTINGTITAGTPCNPQCTPRVWDGPQRRVLGIAAACGTHAGVTQTQISGQVFWACRCPGGGNGCGHARMFGNGGWECSFDGISGGSLSMYINFFNASATTATPTTGWWQSDNLPNITLMYRRLQAAEVQVVRLTRQANLTYDAVQSTAVTADIVAGQMVGVVANLTNVTVAAQMLSTSMSQQSAAVQATTATLSQQLSSLVSSLRGAASNTVPSTCSGAQCAVPTITATAQGGLNMTALGGPIQVQQQGCSTDDLCDATSFAATLKQVLNSL